MNVEETKLEGLKIIQPNSFGDDRGFFFESFQKKRYAEHGIKDDFVQDNVSFSQKGVLRGLHFQTGDHAQGKLVQVLRGQVYDVVCDLRKDSKTYGEWLGFHLSAENKTQIFVPKGFAHGFLTMEDNTLFSYKCTQYYFPESEQSLCWNDKTLNIDWPIDNPTLSQKDQKGLSFEELS